MAVVAVRSWCPLVLPTLGRGAAGPRGVARQGGWRRPGVPCGPQQGHGGGWRWRARLPACAWTGPRSPSPTLARADAGSPRQQGQSPGVAHGGRGSSAGGGWLGRPLRAGGADGRLGRAWPSEHCLHFHQTRASSAYFAIAVFSGCKRLTWPRRLVYGEKARPPRCNIVRIILLVALRDKYSTLGSRNRCDYTWTEESRVHGPGVCSISKHTARCRTDESWNNSISHSSLWSTCSLKCCKQYERCCVVVMGMGRGARCEAIEFILHVKVQHVLLSCSRAVFRSGTVQRCATLLLPGAWACCHTPHRVEAVHCTCQQSGSAVIAQLLCA